MGLLGEKQGMMGAKASMMGAAPVQEEGGPMVEPPVAEQAPAEDQEFAGIMQGIEVLQTGVQDVIAGMVDMESQTVSDPEGIAKFLTGLGELLAQFQGAEQAAPAAEAVAQEEAAAPQAPVGY